MAFFGGPSKDALLNMAQGIASIAMQLKMLNELDESAKREILSGMAAEGSPTNMKDLIIVAANVIQEQNMGWYKKNQFLGMIYGSLLSVGMSHTDAKYIKGLIEVSV